MVQETRAWHDEAEEKAASLPQGTVPMILFACVLFVVIIGPTHKGSA